MGAGPQQVVRHAVEAVSRLGRHQFFSLIVLLLWGTAAGGLLCGVSDAENPGGSRVGASIPQPLQSSHQHRIKDNGLRQVERRVQQLIVPGRREAELRANCLLLGTGVAPPFAFEGEDALLT